MLYTTRVIQAAIAGISDINSANCWKLFIDIKWQNLYLFIRTAFEHKINLHTFDKKLYYRRSNRYFLFWISHVSRILSESSQDSSKWQFFHVAFNQMMKGRRSFTAPEPMTHRTCTWRIVFGKRNEQINQHSLTRTILFNQKSRNARQSDIKLHTRLSEMMTTMLSRRKLMKRKKKTSAYGEDMIASVRCM